MKTITVFTPSYNRAYCLWKCYESLLRQTSTDFKWLIVDDGSTDDTQKIVQGWINEGKIDIQYHYQKNQGMHGAHNAAYRLIDTELNVCIDSDDYMTDDAIEKIVSFWREKGSDKYAGMVGLDAFENGKIIGDVIPETIKETTFYDLYFTHNIRGDKKFIYRTEIIKKYPSYPIFEGEKFVPLDYIYILIDQDYPILPFNEVLCVVEYMPDGSTRNILYQYRRHPKGFAFSRKIRMKLAKSFQQKFRNAIHYVSSSIFIKNSKFIQESPKKLSTLFAIPFGLLLHFYILYNTRDKSKL